MPDDDQHTKPVYVVRLRSRSWHQWKTASFADEDDADRFARGRRRDGGEADVFQQTPDDDNLADQD